MERIPDDQTVITHPETGGRSQVARKSVPVWQRRGWVEADDKAAEPAVPPAPEKTETTEVTEAARPDSPKRSK